MSSRIRVTAQLLDARSRDLLWGDRIDSDASDIINVQDTIAQRIVEGLQLKLGSDEEVALAAHMTANTAAYDEYLRGRDRVGKYVYHTVANEDVETAARYFKRAIELDCDFALAYCGLGGCHIQRVLKGSGKPADLREARAAFEKGLTLDPRIIEARVYMVFVELAQNHKQRARMQIAKLRHEAPNNAAVHLVSAVIYRLDGEYEKALQSFDLTLRLNPGEAVGISWNRARIFMYQGRYDDELFELDRGATIEPNHPLLKVFRAQVLMVSGDLEIASELFRDVLISRTDMNGIRPLYAQCLSARGDHEAARAQLTERVREMALLDHDVSYWLGGAYAMEGEHDEALTWLRKAIDLGNEAAEWFESNPAWQSLHDDERFTTLLRELRARQETERDTLRISSARREGTTRLIN